MSLASQGEEDIYCLCMNETDSRALGADAAASELGLPTLRELRRLMEDEQSGAQWSEAQSQILAKIAEVTKADPPNLTEIQKLVDVLRAYQLTNILDVATEDSSLKELVAKLQTELVKS